MKREQYGYYEASVSILLNLLLFFLKLWAGIVSNSLALTADAWHTLTDSLSSVVVFASTKASQKPPDKEHPFGHGRYELIGSFIIGIFLALVGFSFFKEGLKSLAEPREFVFGAVAFTITLISALVKEGLARYAFWCADKSGIKSLKADGWHHRSDAVSSVIILVSIFLGGEIWWIDGVLSIAVSCLIFYSAWDVIRDSVSTIIGSAADPETRTQLCDLCNSTAGFDVKMHHLHVHEYGVHTEMTFHICLPGSMRVSESHNLTTRIGERIRKELNCISTIHVDPDV